jgi:hypothetical protein
LPDPDGPSSDEQAVHTGVAHRAQHVQRAHDLGVAAEKHPGVEFFERLPPAIRRPIRLSRWGPHEVVRGDPGAADRLAQLMQTGLGEHHRRPTAHRNGFHVLSGQPVGEQVGVLPLASVSAGAVLQAGAQDLLAHVFRRPVLGQALRRGLPIP